MATALDCNADQALASLQSPARNRYYYGKLLDQHHLELEQRYGILQRWLMNRLSVGMGVLCGLRVSASADGSRVGVSPGVAVDGYGREIIVPRQSRAVDPHLPTDACGRPAGAPVRRIATLYICYHECEEEPAPVVVSECEPEPACENGIIRERYLLRIAEGVPPMPGILSAEQCAQIFGPLPQGASRYELLCDTMMSDCAAPAEACVPLAILQLDEAGRVTVIDECARRPVLFSNAMLLDLILCLAARVDLCCGPEAAIRSLAIHSGDQQTASVATLLPEPVVARVTEGGAAVAGETVTFTIDTGGGALGDDPSALGGSFSAKTDAAGLATLPHRRLGPAAGEQRVRVSIPAGMPAQVLVTATAIAPSANLPVVAAIWPANAMALSPDAATEDLRAWAKSWLSAARIEITFSHEMQPAAVQQPDPWLRVFQLRSFGPNEIEVMRVPIAYVGSIANPQLGQPGFTEAYRLNFTQDGLDDEQGLRFLVLMRAEGTNITDQSTSALLLDAEFAGTTLPAARLDEIWQLTASDFFPQSVWDALVDTGAEPPSGNGQEGGRFESWFQVSLAV